MTKIKEKEKIKDISSESFLQCSLQLIHVAKMFLGSSFEYSHSLLQIYYLLCLKLHNT